MNLFLILRWINSDVTEDSRDLADLQRAFIVAVMISDLLWVTKLIPELKNSTVSEGSNVNILSLT